MALDFDATVRQLGLGYLYPYHDRKPKDKAEQIACAILYDLCDRSGIKHGFNGIDADVRRSIVKDLAAIVRVGIEASELPQFDDYEALMKHIKAPGND
jgi:hypothetical protein